MRFGKKIHLLVLGLFFVFSLYLTSSALAAPAVSAVQGTVSKGNQVTVVGSAFGAHASYSQDGKKLNWAWHNFEGASLSGDGFAPAPASGGSIQWQLATTGGRPGSSYWAKRVDTLGGNDNMGGMKKGEGGVSYPGIAFVSFWFKIPRTATSGKFARFAGNGTPANDPDFMVDTGGTDFNIRAGNYSTVQWGSANSFADSTWQRFDLLIDAAGNSEKSWIVGQNGNNPQWTLNWTIAGLDSYFGANIGAGKDSGGTTDSNYYGFDDIFIDFTQARVELCNSSSWSGRSQCEIQIPVTWTSSSIGIQVNQGAFPAGGTAYLYVVDQSGAVNSTGFPITIGQGSGGGGQVTLPVSPVQVQVK